MGDFLMVMLFFGIETLHHRQLLIAEIAYILLNTMRLKNKRQNAIPSIQPFVYPYWLLNQYLIFSEYQPWSPINLQSLTCKL
jgi:hypothetical protein